MQPSRPAPRRSSALPGGGTPARSRSPPAPSSDSSVNVHPDLCPGSSRSKSTRCPGARGPGMPGSRSCSACPITWLLEAGPGSSSGVDPLQTPICAADLPVQPLGRSLGGLDRERLERVAASGKSPGSWYAPLPIAPRMPSPTPSPMVTKSPTWSDDVLRPRNRSSKVAQADAPHRGAFRWRGNVEAPICHRSPNHDTIGVAVSSLRAEEAPHRRAHRTSGACPADVLALTVRPSAASFNALRSGLHRCRS